MAATINDNNKIVNTTRVTPPTTTTVYTPVPGPAGASAYQVWLTAGNSGPVASFLNFLKGPKGDKGDPGAAGTNGTNGLPGGTGPKGDKGDKGDTGNTGKSTYELWLSQGNTGSLAQYLATLVGQKGDKGDKGDTGPIGPGGGKSAYQLWLDAGNTGTLNDFFNAYKGATGASGTKAGIQITPATFGMHPNYSRSSIRPELGYGTLRLWDVQLSPLHYSSAAGVYNWTNLDNIVNAAVAAGIKVLYTLGNYPAYMNADGSSTTASASGTNYNSKVPDLTKLNTFLTDLATRYKGKITAYEVWNEWQDSPALGLTGGNAFYSGTLAQMVSICQTTSSAIKAADPSALVISPSITGPTNYVLLDSLLAAMKTAGLNPNTVFDGIGYHPYPQPTDAPEALIPLTQKYMAAATKNGVNLPFWATEYCWYSWLIGGGVQKNTNIGTGTGDEVFMPLHQMFEYVTRAHLSLLAAGVSYMINYGGLGASTFSGFRFTDRDNTSGLNAVGLQLKQFFSQMNGLRTQSYAQDPTTGLNVLTLIDGKGNGVYAVWGADTAPVLTNVNSLDVLTYSRTGFSDLNNASGNPFSVAGVSQSIETRPSLLYSFNTNTQLNSARTLLSHAKVISTLNTNPRVTSSGGNATGWSFDSGSIAPSAGDDAPLGALAVTWTPTARYKQFYSDLPSAAITNMAVGKKYRAKIVYKINTASQYTVSVQQTSNDQPVTGSGYYNLDTTTDGYRTMSWEFTLTTAPTGNVRLRVMSNDASSIQPISISTFQLDEIPLDPTATVITSSNPTVTTGSVVNGRLVLTLSNNTTIDAGNVFITYSAIANSERTINVGSAVATLGGNFPTGTDAVVINVTGGNIYYTVTGTTPSSASPELTSGNQYEITSLADVTNFKAIASTGTPVLKIYFEQRSN